MNMTRPPAASRSRLTLTLALFVFLLAALIAGPVYFERRARAAGGFTSGNLVIYRVGDGTAALSSAATAAFLDEYTTSGGARVQAIALPTTTVGGNRRITNSGTATSEGELALSTNGQYLTAIGYDAATATAGVAGSTSATVNRVVARVDSSGAVDTTTALNDAASGSNPRGVISTDGTNLWVDGGAGGARFATLAGTTSTQLSTTTTNLRQIYIFDGQLYVSSASGSLRLGSVGSGTPTTSGQTITQLPGVSATLTSPYGFFFAHLNGPGTAVDTLYICDDSTSSGGLFKYSLIAGTWTLNGTAIGTANGVHSVTGTVSGSTVTLYIVSASSLYTITDSSGYNATNNGTLTSIGTAGANTAFRGIAFAPGSAATPTPTPTPSPTATPTPTPTDPTGTGSSNPNSVLPGASTLLTVNVTPGTNPPSTGLAVTADLSSIGGSATQSFSGAGNTFTFTANVSNGTTPGIKSLPFTVTDAQSRLGSGSISLTVKTTPPPNNVVISQVYGGGGNTGADFKNDFIELVNHSNAAVSLNGWSVQVFVGGNWTLTPLPNFTLQPGQYYLIQESQGAGGTEDLPTPDATGTITMSATSTKVALVNNTVLLSGACPDADAGAFGIVDFVGYGGTDCFEGSAAAPTLDNLTAAFRRNEGCLDTNDNAADFTTGSPNPRNSSSPTHDCTTLFGYGSANPSSVLVGNTIALTVEVGAAQNPTSTGITVIADLSAIGGSAAQMFSGNGSVFTFNATVDVNTSGGFKSLPVTITDAQARSFSTNIVLSVLPLVPDHITISQIYGGGGNSSATYQNDFVELYNPTGSPVSVTGWSIQYASATGTSWTNKQPIGGTIGPGEYFLVALGSGGNVGAPLPPSQISGGINMSATTGKVALVSNSDALAGPCPLGTDPDIVDFVGYGSTANCHEGGANAAAPSNTTAILRKSLAINGTQDTDQNGNDFVVGTPNPRQTAPIVELGPWVAGTDPATNGTTVPHDATITVDFSEPVNVDPGWYNIICASTGSHNDATVANTNNFKTYAITPNTNFQFGEQCTVTIPKNTIHDQDTDDSAPNTDTLLDDYTWSFTVVAAGQPAPYPPSVHLTMGDPGCGTPLGCAVASTSQPNNFLMSKPTYALSYNRDKGTPNWVSWHLDSSWYGTLARVDTFRADPQVPPDWYRVEGFDYSGSGFDRGHMTPNADRDNQNRVPINQETYLMTNMVPQAPDNNQGPWANLEAYLRTQTDAGNEIYIASGPQGVGGSGSNGGTTTTIANGHVTVPAKTWKVALVLPQGSDDINRATCGTRTIAVIMPNTQGIRTNDPNDWQTYLTTVSAVEQLTGLDFYQNLPAAVQACVKNGTNGTNPPGTADQSATTAEDTAASITLSALSPDPQATFTYTYTQPSHGSVTGAGPNLIYTPAADSNGGDSFTFFANDGHANSNTSTVHISVTEVNDPPTTVDDAKTTPEDTPLSFSASDLTANDSPGPANESSQILTVSSVTPGANTHGTVSLQNGVINYTPAANYNGPASFSYTVCDDGTTNGAPDSKCASATVSVTVQPVNDAPVAGPQSLSTNEDTPLSITLTGSDVETAPANLHFQVTQGPAHGILTGTAPNLSYVPASNYNGTDAFKFTVTDSGDGASGPLTSNEATISVTINPVNDPPVANGQTIATNSNTPVAITLTGSDVETLSTALTFNVTSGPSHGSLSGSGANRTYTPGPNYSGTDSFKFTVTDTGDGASPALTSNEATVSITVNDTVPPVITLNGNTISLWPPNGSLHLVNVSDLVAGASDNFDPNVNLARVVIASVSSDEGTAASGDILIAGDCKSVQLRATRNDNGDGRVYTITFRARDAAGNSSFVTAKVTVPHNQGNGGAVDSGAAYTITSSCP